jgi:hypothetical protein
MIDPTWALTILRVASRTEMSPVAVSIGWRSMTSRMMRVGIGRPPRMWCFSLSL